jgi:hypothetical protein
MNLRPRPLPCGCVLAGPYALDWLGPFESLCSIHRAASRANATEVRRAVDSIGRLDLIDAHPYAGSVTDKTSTRDLRDREYAIRIDAWSRDLRNRLLSEQP